MKKILLIVIIIAGVLAAGALVYTDYLKQPKKVTETEVLSSEAAGDKVINFINDVVLKGEGTASLVEVIEESGLYDVRFNVGEQEGSWMITKDGKFIFPQVVDMESFKPPAEEQGTAVGNFSISSDEICKENGKPIIYFFGSESCPHCLWEHPIIEEVVASFGEAIVFHNNMDSEEDMDIFNKYSTGGIPTLVLGCKYYRVGSGENVGKEEEIKNLTSLICELTGNQPAEICQK